MQRQKERRGRATCHQVTMLLYELSLGRGSLLKCAKIRPCYQVWVEPAGQLCNKPSA